jgi:hypothetical protein
LELAEETEGERERAGNAVHTAHGNAVAWKAGASTWAPMANNKASGIDGAPLCVEPHNDVGSSRVRKLCDVVKKHPTLIVCL